MSSQENTRVRLWTIAGIAAALAFAALGVTGSGPASAAGEPAMSEQPDPDPSALTLRGFLRNRNGEFTTIEPPGAAGTKAGGLNDRGEVVGIGYPSVDGTAADSGSSATAEATTQPSSSLAPGPSRAPSPRTSTTGGRSRAGPTTG